MRNLRSHSSRITQSQHRSLPLDPKLVLPPIETPEGAPDLGFLIAFEEPAASEGWSSGIVKAVEDGLDGRHFTIDTQAGRQEVPRELVFYWWSLD